MKRSPFTLIELLVVVAIISVLASLLLPALKKARAAGLAAGCTSNQRQTFLAISLYSADHDGCIPVLATRGDQTNALDSAQNPFPGVGAVTTANRNLYPFRINEYASQHPLYESLEAFNAGIGAVTARPKVPYFCPADRYKINARVATYAGLYATQVYGHTPGSPKWSTLCLPSRRLPDAKTVASDIIMFGESSGAYNYHNQVSFLTVGIDDRGFNGATTDYWNTVMTIGTLPNYAQYVSPSAPYTHGGLNFAMLDGHIVRAANPPHGIWGGAVGNYVYNGAAMPVFDAKGVEPLR
ncbi:MAG: hypothetical protein BWZ02_00331 [Lentisphaerae bacterium ADurb.BinA184]|nr:MAG: hypothetical protein BWZ02_00331 [Lentisphaerae bacterium ADurb.BinA184]